MVLTRSEIDDGLHHFVQQLID